MIENSCVGDRSYIIAFLNQDAFPGRGPTTDSWRSVIPFLRLVAQRCREHNLTHLFGFAYDYPSPKLITYRTMGLINI